MKRLLRILTVALMAAMTSSAYAADDITIGDLTYNFYTSGNAYVKSCKEGVTEVTIPNSIEVNGETKNVTGIGNSAFEGNTTIQKVYLGREGNYAVQIGTNAFKGATSLNTLAYTESSGKGASYRKDGVVVIPTSSSLNNNAFEGCTSITTVTVAYTKQVIPDCAFKGCTKLDSVALGTSCLSIGESAFEGCSSLRKISGCGGNDTGKLTKVGAYAFKGCANLTELGAKGRIYFYYVTSLGEGALEGCSSVTYVTMPEVKEIANNTFKDCTSLKRIGATEDRLRPVATKIGDSAFENCSSATYFLDANLTEIGANAFKNSGIETFYTGGGTYYTKRITLTNNVTKIGESAFEGTPSTIVFFADGTVPETLGANAFTSDPAKRVLLPMANLIKESYEALVEYDPRALLLLNSMTPVVVSAKMTVSLNNSNLVYKYVKSVSETDEGVTVETEDTPEKVIPANTALIIESIATANTNYYFHISPEPQTPTYQNYLTANTEETTLPASDGKINYYTFAPIDGDDFLTFAKVIEETTMPAGSGYLKVVNGTPTAIRELRADDKKADVYYNLNGVRVENPQKGIFIRNGKKVVIK